jgi:hypothetical protein
MVSRCGLLRFVALLAVAGCLAPGIARAEILFSDGFEAPHWTAGQVLFYGTNPANNGWSNGSTNALNTITSVNPASGSQALQMQFAGNASIFAPGQFVTFGALTGGSTVNPANPATATFSTDVRLDGPRTTGAGLQASISTGPSWMTLSSFGYVYAGSHSQFSAPAALGQYHNLAMLFDYGQHTTTFFVDGVSIGTESTPSITPAGVGTVNLIGDFISDPAHLDPSAYALRFDNVQVATTTPEPASLALLGLGGLGMTLFGLRSRRRKRAAAAAR